MADSFDIDWSDRFGFGGPRSAEAVVRIVVHTTENDASTTAEAVANYQINSQTGSYHNLVDSRGVSVRCNTQDWITWSTGNNAGNVFGLNISFVARAAWTRAQWLAQDRMLRRGARVCAAWVKDRGIPVVKVDGRANGFCGHGDLRVWGGTDHTDPGPNFPWDVFLEYVKQEVSGNGGSAPAPAPAPNPAPVTAISTDTRVGLLLDQLVGPKRDASGAPTWEGWPQLNGKTVVDFLAELGKVQKQILDRLDKDGK